MSEFQKCLLVLSLVLGIAVLHHLTDPFKELLPSKSVSMRHLNAAQKHNLLLASRNLDKLVLRPGEEFSFNQRVGPRTVERGFQEARSFLEDDSPATPGGGICLLSSALYQMALLIDLPVIERFAHSKPIASADAGLDATVSYGQADLRFANNKTEALLFRIYMTNQNLRVQIYAKHKLKLIQLSRHTQTHGDKLLVSLYKKTEAENQLITLDEYKLGNQIKNPKGQLQSFMQNPWP